MVKGRVRKQIQYVLTPELLYARGAGGCTNKDVLRDSLNLYKKGILSVIVA